MNGFSLTLRDLTRALEEIDIQPALAAHAETAAREIERNLAERGQSARAFVERTGTGVSVEVSGSRLWDREHGGPSGEAEGNLDAVLNSRRRP